MRELHQICVRAKIGCRNTIGDIHGRADLLERLLTHINANHSDTRIVFLGDIIDRGPDSKDCLNMVGSELDRNRSSKLIMGNHEDLMLRFVNGGSAGSRSWCGTGAQARWLRTATRDMNFPVTMATCTSATSWRTVSRPNKSPT
ncbi:metallophosphoesterase [Rhizobium ruizarguesonis]|uniref:metallophosphoesterase n=1 Tax=Rhizobium ruizarguesonis TaxID=2081791 RepID=UPI00102FAF5B|nr:hypothetical protein ELH74_37680 [Rhizobium ruizarguesonis]TBD07702.1 hypothetical protein ELH23_38960 [Rhizobium ruizarguesonis]